MSRTKGQSSFVQDIQALRERARQHIEDGAQTSDYRADRDTVLRLLNEALATEIVCVLRYVELSSTPPGFGYFPPGSSGASRWKMLSRPCGPDSVRTYIPVA